jgi:outer membrane lipoprotein-sorting protein
MKKRDMTTGTSRIRLMRIERRTGHSTRTLTALALLAGACGLLAARTASAALDKTQMVDLLKTVDDRQRNNGDWRANAYIEQKEKDKVDVVYETVYFRRSQDAKFMILFTKPKSSAGQGYLRIDQNLWFYDPSVGKWERRTERERIGGTNSRRSDFDESRLAEEYDPKDEGEETLGKFHAQKLFLTGKAGLDLAFPTIRLWVDKDTKNILKRQEYALSGKLLRTSYYPKWKKIYSPSRKGDVWYPEEMRFFDEVERANSTLILIKAVDPNALPANLFTKAWLESKSR